MLKRLTRAEVPKDQTWDLSDLFATEEAWEAGLNELLQSVETITQFKGRLGQGADVLLQCLDAEEEPRLRAIRVITYASLRLSEDATNPTYQAGYARVTAAFAEVNAPTSFMESEIIELPESTIEAYLEQEVGLQTYRKVLQDLLEKKPYRLSAETEEVLAGLSEVLSSPFNIYSSSKGSDMQFDPIQTDEGEKQVSLTLYEAYYEQSSNTDERRKAFASYTKALKQYKNTYAATYATEVKKQVILARTRKYESVTQMLLHDQKVTEEMYHNILDIVQEELAPHMRRLASITQKSLGLDKMLLCDLKAPLDPEYDVSISFEEATTMVLEGLEVMGPEYMAIMNRAMNERWVDYSDNIGKRSGAFCSSPYGVHPYILMTWAGQTRSAFTLAHELGHAGHFYLAGGNQRLHNTRPSLYFIEAPSTLNELLLGHALMNKTKDVRMKRDVILQLLGTYFHNFVTHLLEGELQRRVYRHAEAGKAITADVLCELKGEVLSNFWGDSVEIEEGARLTWMRQPHYYMGLYPYTYAAGLAASTAVAQLIQAEGAPVAQRWIEVLKAGGTMKPLELMKKAGVDMSSPEPIRQAVAYVGSLIDELERSL